MPSSERVLDAPVYPLYGRALVVAVRLLRQLPDAALGQRLPLQPRLFLRIPARVVIDQRHAPRRQLRQRGRCLASFRRGCDGQ